MLVLSGIDEVEGAVGKSLGPSEWLEITQERVNLFADATDDHQWIHVDAERAAQGPFGATIAHGFLTLSLIPYLGSALMRIDGVAMKINYGLNKVRFPSPVTVGSRVRATGEVLEVQRNPKGASIIVQYTIEIDGESKPACVAETVTLIVP
ncbi:MAG: MaoC family dehydratase [Rhodococcus sp.]|nr:MaoC family dehydratase [Rhodococcus sp. (in: high G+C Gram-positive bacteria)]